MPELVPISHRELARKLRRAGFVETGLPAHCGKLKLHLSILMS